MKKIEIDIEEKVLPDSAYDVLISMADLADKLDILGFDCCDTKEYAQTELAMSKAFTRLVYTAIMHIDVHIRHDVEYRKDYVKLCEEIENNTVQPHP